MSYSKRQLSTQNPALKFPAATDDEAERACLLAKHGADWLKVYWPRHPKRYLTPEESRNIARGGYKHYESRSRLEKARKSKREVGLPGDDIRVRPLVSCEDCDYLDGSCQVYDHKPDRKVRCVHFTSSLLADDCTSKYGKEITGYQ